MSFVIVAAICLVVGAVCGYAFRGKEVKALRAAGAQLQAANSALRNSALSVANKL